MHDSPTAVFIIKLKQHKTLTFCENQLKRKAIASGDKGLDRNWLRFVLIKTNDHVSGRQNRHSRPNSQPIWTFWDNKCLSYSVQFKTNQRTTKKVYKTRTRDGFM